MGAQVMSRLLALLLLITVQGRVQGDRPHSPLRHVKMAKMPNQLKLHTEAIPEASLEQIEQRPLTTTTNKSWLSRLGDAMVEFVLGIILIPFALALMWMNELRNARQESILQLGTSEVQAISSKSVDSENHGTLVLLNDAETRGLELLEDFRFPAVSLKGLRLKSIVEVYQWEEHKSEKKSKDSLGGGETTERTYSYSKKWSRFAIDSTHFQQPQHRNSVCVAGFQVGEQEKVNSTVQYGEGFYLPESLVKCLDNWVDAQSLVKEPLKFSSYTFEQSGSWFYHPKRPSPEVGDVRVSFECVHDGPASIMALQCAGKGPGASFMPYRLVSRGFCGMPELALKSALLAQGKKSPDELYEEDACQFGPLACLCCCCNLVTRFFANTVPPQIYAAFHGHLSQTECLEKLQLKGMMLKWGIRILSWLLLYAATYMLFKPLIVALDIIPFLGKYVSSGTSFVLAFVIFLITAMLATVVISIAYLFYHPLMALISLACLGLLLGAVSGLGHVF